MVINARVYENSIQRFLKNLGRSESPMAFTPSIYNSEHGLEGLHNVILQKSITSDQALSYAI